MAGDPVDDAMAQASGPYSQPSGDPVDAAMAQAATSGSSSASAQPTVQPPKDLTRYAPTRLVDDFVSGLSQRMISSAAGAVAGGLHGLWDIATGKGGAQAASDVSSTQSAVQSKPSDPMQAAGAAVAQSNWNPINWIPAGLSKGGQFLGDTAERFGAPPWLSASLDVAPSALASFDPLLRSGGKVFGKPYEVEVENPPPTAEEVLSRSTNPQQSMGAAAASPNLTNASPGVRAGIVAGAQKTGGAVNPEIAARHLEADSLPVPMQLSDGQASRDPQIFSTEQNERGRNPIYAQQFQQQEGQLVQNLRAIRDNAGPDVFSANPVEHGDTLINAYKEKDAAAQADIRAKYQALADANGGDLPVDGQAFVNAADAALKKQMKAPFLPAPVQTVLQGLRDGGPMTMENFENLRTTLAAEGRKAERAGDGNAEAAVNTVRDALENVPMQTNSAQIKVLADSARSAAKARFDMLRDDPAYKAAVNDSVAPDRFVQKFVIGAPRDQVATMAQNLSDNPVARQTMAVGAIDHLRQSAGIDPLDNGRFRQSGFNRQLQALGPKLSSIVDPRTAENLEKLGNVARNIQEAPPGSFVNTSNTLTGALAEHAKGAAEQLINAKAGGIPVATWARRAAQNRAAARAAAQSFRPAAGVERLSTVVPKP